MVSEILLLDRITKVYPNGFVANKEVTLSANEGEIHALVGENGAGKTTLMKILFGIEQPEEGRIFIRGEETHVKDPLDAIAKGIGMVHQHFMMVPSLTVAENIILGIEPKNSRRMVDMKRAVEMTAEVCEKYNFPIDPQSKVEDLSVGQKQKVEILKALIRGAEVLILDEPTAVLTPQETAELFVQLKMLKEAGHTIIFISHKLAEVKELCDRVTVLRQGRTVGTSDMADVTEVQISRMMVGRDVVLKIEKEKAEPKDDVVVRVDDLTYRNDEGKNVINGVSFGIRSGEILGIAGVEGNGQKELSEIMTGLMDYNHGSVKINGVEVRGHTIRKLRELGIAHISEDRMTYGCSSSATIEENIISDRYYKKEFNNGPLLNEKYIDGLIDQYIMDFNIKCDDGTQPVRMLSGGNIQKVVVAREFTSDSNVIIANQPTRGIDVGATEFIRKKLIELSRESDMAVLLISADLNEVLEVSDTLIVMHGGEIAAYFDDASLVDEVALGEYMLGLKKMSEEEIRRATHEH